MAVFDSAARMPWRVGFLGKVFGEMESQQDNWNFRIFFKECAGRAGAELPPTRTHPNYNLLEGLIMRRICPFPAKYCSGC